MNEYKKLSIAYADNSRKENYVATGCRAGKYCPNSKEKRKAFDTSCEAGYYCPSTILKKSCVLGFYCPENVSRPFACPYDRPNSKPNETSIDGCY